ncbi:MAG: hypothetical protein JZU55_13225, partial [Afipia sp.]|nr:hypothetical protein [Afipia sp.]
RSADEFAALIKQAEQGLLASRGTPEMQMARFRHHIAQPTDEFSSTAVERFVDHYVAASDS